MAVGSLFADSFLDGAGVFAFSGATVGLGTVGAGGVAVLDTLGAAGESVLATGAFAGSCGVS